MVADKVHKLADHHEPCICLEWSLIITVVLVGCFYEANCGHLFEIDPVHRTSVELACSAPTKITVTVHYRVTVFDRWVVNISAQDDFTRVRIHASEPIKVYSGRNIENTMKPTIRPRRPIIAGSTSAANAASAASTSTSK